MKILVVIFLFLLPAISVQATIRLPAIFSDHMVLQRSAETPVWGWADPGEEIVIAWNDNTARVTTGADGKWVAHLDLTESGVAPFTMEIRGTGGKVITDVVVGEVWLASGQSNMEWLLKNTAGAEAEIRSSANPTLRQFRVHKASVAEPAEDCAGEWTVAGPDSSGSFSAVGYYFAKAVQSELNVPVGIINSSWGGSPAEAWISAKALSGEPELKTSAEVKWKKVRDYPVWKSAFAESFAQWLKKTGREDRSQSDAGAFAGPEAAGKTWVPITLPGPVRGEGLPETGAIWCRKEVVLPEAAHPNETFLVELGEIAGFESAYWNGRRLLETTPANFPGTGYWRRFSVPPEEARKGSNVLAIRVFAPEKPPGFLIPARNFKAGRAFLSGPWLASAEYVLAPPSVEELQAAPRAPAAPLRERDVASHLFNGMIHPLLPYGIRGVIWYQGEANANRASQYQTTFPLLIQDWREHWNVDELPFYFCQLANFMEKKNLPEESAWAELREAQTSALKLPGTGQAVLIDLGDSEDIHPRDKRSVGARLAALALANTYGRDLPAGGPQFEAAVREGNTMRVRFTNVGGGLIAKTVPDEHSVSGARNATAPLIRNRPESELEGFAICGADREWVWADARIDGDSVLVSSSGVAEPAAVRYAWANNPTANLYSREGLPAAPFRTDKFPPVTIGKKY